MQLEGRIAVVTGASRGIGRAVAKRFAAEGATVVCIARTIGALEELDDEIKALGGTAVLCPLNLRQFDDIDKVAGALFQRFGKVDILASIAGELGGGLAPVGHLDHKRYAEAVDVNITANHRLIRCFTPLLRMSDAGRAIFTTAPQASQISPFWGVYGATKAAMEVMVKTWAVEMTNISDLKINLVNPGVVATRLREIAFPGEDQKTIKQPDDIAETYVNLAKPSCTIHGQVVSVL